jgi:hypothetical protein
VKRSRPIGAAFAIALMLAPADGTAAGGPAPDQNAAMDPWLMLSLLEPTGETPSIILAGCAALAAQEQPAGQPPASPTGCLPPASPRTGGGKTGIYAGVAVAAAAGIGAAIALGGKHHDHPNSPA